MIKFDERSMENYKLLCALAAKAGVSPISMLYTFVEDTLEQAAGDVEFQEDWIEVAEETGERVEAAAFFQKLLP